MDSKEKLMKLLAVSMGVGMMTGGEYSGLGIKMPRGKPQRGHLVGCHVCGATHGTLYKDGDQRICGECRKKKGAKGNGN